jgi:hypothetical protein
MKILQRIFSSMPSGTNQILMKKSSVYKNAFSWRLCVLYGAQDLWSCQCSQTSNTDSDMLSLCHQILHDYSDILCSMALHFQRSVLIKSDTFRGAV